MSKKRDNDTRYADCILSALNNVERIRKDACGEFHRYGETAHNLWQMAQGMERSIIRENGAKHINSDGFKKAPLPLRQRGFAQSASELSCAPLKRRNGNGAILEASEFDCAEGGGK